MQPTHDANQVHPQYDPAHASWAQPGYTPPPSPAKAPWYKGRVFIGIAAFIIGVGVGGTDTSSSTTATSKPVPATSATASPVAATGTIPGAGTYAVGTEVQPGTYRAGVLDDSVPSCYWARLKDTTGDYGTIIANGLTQSGTVTVTIKATDGAFKTQGCTAWTKIS